jgi:hypothetical protein
VATRGFSCSPPAEYQSLRDFLFAPTTLKI